MLAECETDPPTSNFQKAIYRGLLSGFEYKIITKNQQGLLVFDGYFQRNIQNDWQFLSHEYNFGHLFVLQWISELFA
jgi:hypothetical protein